MQATFERAHFPFTQPDEQLRPWLETRRTLKRRPRRSAGWATLLGLILVLTTGLLTGWYVAPRLDVNLSEIAALPDAMGFSRSTDTAHPTVGYVPNLTDNERSGALCESTVCISSQ